MASSSDPIAAVSQQLNDFFTAQLEDTSEYGTQAAIMRDAAAAAVAGGKRLRARFCIAGFHAGLTRPAPNTLPSPVIAAAAALEIFHAAALVHDDLIDNSDTRRGRPSAHRGLQATHRRSGWHGDDDAFGRAGALLVGDLLVAFSDDLLEQGLRTAEQARATAARDQYARMRRDVTIGQFLDVAEEHAFATAPDARHADRALRVASLKSARYTVEQPLLIGACLAGADRRRMAALSAFGHPVGMAFQLRDDVLGVFGDEHVTGKPSGDDLREGKRTLLIAYAREALPDVERSALDERLGDPTLDAAHVRALQRTIVDTGALARVEHLIADYSNEARRALTDARLSPAAVEELGALAGAAVTRSS